MHYPDEKKFKEFFKKGGIDAGVRTPIDAEGRTLIVPVYREILADTETPVSVFMKLEEASGGRDAFIFESVEKGEKWGRFSFIGASPVKIIKTYGRRVETTARGGEITVQMMEDPADPIDAVKAELDECRPTEAAIEGLPPFFGGLVGYIGYENVKFFDRVPDREKPGTGLPDMYFMVVDTVVVFDNLRQVIKVISNARVKGESPDEANVAYKEAVDEIDRVVDILSKGRARPLALNPPDTVGVGCTYHCDSDAEFSVHPMSDADSEYAIKFKSSFGKVKDFKDAVEKCKEYIRAGDAFQLVLSQRFEGLCDADPFDIYRALRVENPSPYMFYINTGDARLIGSSPEILVRLEDGRIKLRPIAGTRRRGTDDYGNLDPKLDNALEKELLADPKENAEHIMLVDLGRNDVGRVAKIGSVKVTELKGIERYSHVMHIVSNVEGELREGLDAFDVLRACFPAGTVSGAPKVRAMEIIDELEPVKRGPYAGAVGYFGYSGNMDTCITIRTLMMKDGKIYIQAGAGIVADSVPEKEFEETINKAMGMMTAVKRVVRFPEAKSTAKNPGAKRAR
jgi:anthranilate synthase component 1